MKYFAIGFILFTWTVMARIMWLLARTKAVPIIEIEIEVVGGPCDGDIHLAKLGVGDGYSLKDNTGTCMMFSRADVLDNSVHVAIRAQ